MAQAGSESTSVVERFGITELDLNRRDAANLNPLIGKDAQDTMSRCAEFLRSLGNAAADRNAAARYALKSVVLALEYDAFQPRAEGATTAVSS